MTKSNFQLFFKQNSFQFGNEPSPNIDPGRTLTALRQCLKHYYETYGYDTRQPINYLYKVIAGGTGELPDRSNVAILPDVSCSHEYLIRYYASIFFGQLFLELFIVDLLDKVSPIICRVKFKDQDLLSKLNEPSAQTLPEKTISFSQILERMKLVFASSELHEKHEFLKKYLFLTEHYETLELMRDLRNDIVHSGQRILYHYSYELLFINSFLPLVKNFISTEKNTVPFNRNLHCNLNVLDELCRYKLPENYLVAAIYNDLKESLHRINHFKELGRSSLENPLFMGEWGNELLKQRMFEHNRFEKDGAEMRAKSICDSKNIKTIHVCPCCGSKACIPMKIGDNQIPFELTCLVCSYTIEDYIGEPRRFGIMEENVYLRQ